MIEVILDEVVFAPKAAGLDATIKTALWAFVELIWDNPDDPDLFGTDRDGYRASQFTSGWILDWEVIRGRGSWIVDLSYGTPKQIKLWDVRAVKPAG
jgi:hypothetical protein